MRFKNAAAIAVAGSLMATTVLAQEWPSKAITYIIPYGAGGTSDIGARTWGPFMEACLGTTIVFVNRPGAGGEVGFAELALAEPDGYTWGALNVPNSPLGEITKDSPAYKMDDFVLLGNMYGSIVSLNARRGGEFETLQDLVDAAKERQVNVGISNLGSDDHTKMMAFWSVAGVQPTYIPLADAANARNAVIGGHVDASGNAFTEVVPFQDELITLAIASPERRPELPDVPTFRELGYDVVGGSSHVIGAPAGTPQEIVDKIDACFQDVGQNPEFLAQAAERNLLVQQRNHQEVTDWLAAETELLRTLWEENRWASQ
jgi:tripartite-type tricarboxylate transporter receptor subunit TctC